MSTLITQGVKVSVESVFQPEYSNADRQHYMFAYRITIENLSDQTVQLIKRHWKIFDSIGELKTVDGEGVVGEQPILNPKQSHQYVSGCNLKSDIGLMKGHYEMINLKENLGFEVKIPSFNLIADYRFN